MASVNRVTLLGNCGRDPEVRYLPSGKAICNISIATSNKWKDKDGTPHEETQWHRVQFFDKLAEIAGQYITKGSPVYIEGSIKYGKFTNKDGQEQNTVDIVATSMQLLGKSEQQETPRQKPSHDAAKARQLPNKSGFQYDKDDEGDRIPF